MMGNINIETIQVMIKIVVLIAALISTWILGIRLRRRIRKALGRKVEEIDLTSIRTWMAVEEAEKKNEQAIHPNQR